MALTDAEIRALVARGDLGRARDVYMLLAVLDGGAIGRAIRLPIKELAGLLNCSYYRARELRQRVVRFKLIELVGRSDCRRMRPESWRRVPLKGGAITPIMGGDTPPQTRGAITPNGDVSPLNASGGDSSLMGGLVSPPVGGLKAVKDPPYKEKTNTHDSSPASPPPVCLSDIHSEDSGNDLRKWAYPQARSICERFNLFKADANGIASELLAKAGSHWGGVEDGKRSVLALVDTLAGETEIRNGGQLVGAIRNRWGEWIQPGGRLPNVRDILAAEERELAAADDGPLDGDGAIEDEPRGDPRWRCVTCGQMIPEALCHCPGCRAKRQRPPAEAGGREEGGEA